MQARGGSEGADLDNTHGYHIEVGVGNVNPATKWEQAERDATKQDALDVFDAKQKAPARVPIALTRRDRGEWLVTMGAREWMRLVMGSRLGGLLQGAEHQEAAAQGHDAQGDTVRRGEG